MPVRVYLSPKVWREDINAYRPALDEHVPSGARWWAKDHPALNMYIVTVEAPDAMLDAIEADNRQVPITPARIPLVAGINAQRGATVPGALRSAMAQRGLTIAGNVANIGSLLDHLEQVFAHAQEAHGKRKRS